MHCHVIECLKSTDRSIAAEGCHGETLDGGARVLRKHRDGCILISGKNRLHDEEFGVLTWLRLAYIVVCTRRGIGLPPLSHMYNSNFLKMTAELAPGEKTKALHQKISY